MNKLINLLLVFCVLVTNLQSTTSVRAAPAQGTMPYGEIISPTSGTILTPDNTGKVTLVAGGEGGSGNSVKRVRFWAFYDNEWHHLGDDWNRDLNSSHNYQIDWYPGCIPPQEILLAVHVEDMAGNYFMESKELATAIRSDSKDCNFIAPNMHIYDDGQSYISIVDLADPDDKSKRNSDIHLKIVEGKVLDSHPPMQFQRRLVKELAEPILSHNEPYIGINGTGFSTKNNSYTDNSEGRISPDSLLAINGVVRAWGERFNDGKYQPMYFFQTNDQLPQANIGKYTFRPSSNPYSDTSTVPASSNGFVIGYNSSILDMSIERLNPQSDRYDPNEWSFLDGILENHTVIGVSQDGTKVFLVRINKQLQFQTVKSFALLLAHLGASKAFLLDSGGSSQIRVRTQGKYSLDKVEYDLGAPPPDKTYLSPSILLPRAVINSVVAYYAPEPKTSQPTDFSGADIPLIYPVVASTSLWQILSGGGYNTFGHGGSGNPADFFALDLGKTANEAAGLDVVAAANGEVWHTGYCSVVLRHKDDIRDVFTTYYHAYPVSGLAIGQDVNVGDKIATIAPLTATGCGTIIGAAHLHFMLNKWIGNGEPPHVFPEWGDWQPLPFLNIEGHSYPYLKSKAGNEHAGEVLPIPICNPQNKPFCDITSSYTFYDEIKFLNDWRILNGSTAFNGSKILYPEHPLTRLQAAFMLFRWLNADETYTASCDSLIARFKDMAEYCNNPEVVKAVNYLADRGIFKGYGDSTFRPNNYVTRGQTMLILVRTIKKLRGGLPNAGVAFKDTDPAGETDPNRLADLNEINLGGTIGLAHGFRDGNFYQGLNITRGAFAKILARAIYYTSSPENMSVLPPKDVKLDYAKITSLQRAAAKTALAAPAMVSATEADGPRHCFPAAAGTVFPGLSPIAVDDTPVCYWEAENAYRLIEDVPANHWARHSIEVLYNIGDTVGCKQSNGRLFCPDDNISRLETIIMLLRAKYYAETGQPGYTYAPPRATQQIFADIPLSHQYVDWVNEAYNIGLTVGSSSCGSGLRFCTDTTVTRTEAALFLVRALIGKANADALPAALGVFEDVLPSNPHAPEIEELYWRGITVGSPGCGDSFNYCVDELVSRAHMATFIARAFGPILERPIATERVGDVCFSTRASYVVRRPEGGYFIRDVDHEDIVCYHKSINGFKMLL